ncbi:hypothetical protein SAMN06295967_105198 [Belliella buryatensis]|uniref:4-amino-4-deoxy-L-arabinose transferase n=1 Tax=Belliella buryatensis TaxID=1500549 RepID=A0A239CSJ9_9BACT|nr:hypothetical protein [Belliella buryatensis]SNS22852.1 hypothetical protein SAMN06295967_105198 [Belliella buryatensis]
MEGIPEILKNMPRSLLISLLFIIILFQIFSEKIPVNEGAFGNGVFYREVATAFLDQINSDDGYTFLQVQRILPFALLNAIYILFGFDFDSNSLIIGMLIFNLLVITLGVYWYLKIIKKLRLNSKLEALGFILLFLTFPVLKQYWYDPFTTDCLAFVLGIGQVNYFIRYEKSKLLLISLIGAFVWPIIFFAGLILLILPNKALEVYQKERTKTFFPTFAIAVIIACAVILSYSFDRVGQNFTTHAVIWHKLSLLSLTLFLRYVMVNNPINWEKSLPLLLKNFQFKNLFTVITASLGITLIILLISSNNTQINLFQWFQNFWNKNLRYPLDFLPAHTIYYGFLFPILIVFINRVNKAIAKLGVGFFVLFLIIAFLTIHPESRLLISFVPFLVLMILKALRRYNLSNTDLYTVFVINILLSSFWLPINSEQLINTLSQGTYPQSFADWKYFIHFGQYFNFWTYLMATLLFALLIYVSTQFKKRYFREKEYES